MNLANNYWFLCSQNGTIGNPTNCVCLIQWSPFTRRNRMLWRKTPPLTLSVRQDGGSVRLSEIIQKQYKGRLYNIRLCHRTITSVSNTLSMSPKFCHSWEFFTRPHYFSMFARLCSPYEVHSFPTAYHHSSISHNTTTKRQVVNAKGLGKETWNETVSKNKVKIEE